MSKRKIISSIIAICLLLAFTLLNTGDIRAEQAAGVNPVRSDLVFSKELGNKPLIRTTAGAKVPDVSIKLIEPQYVFFGMSKTGEIEVSLSDVSKFHGHLCGGVAFGFRAAQVGLKALYGDKLPVRGEVRVYTSQDTCPADVLSFITRARTNFGNLGGRNDLVLDPKAEKKYYKFVHKKTGKTVILEPIFDPRAEIRPLKMKAKKNPKFRPQFQEAVKNIIPRILFDPADKIFKITVVE